MAALDDGDTWIDERAGAVTRGLDVETITVFECGVRQSKAELEAWFDGVPVEGAVVDI